MTIVGRPYYGPTFPTCSNQQADPHLRQHQALRLDAGTEGLPVDRKFRIPFPAGARYPSVRA